MTVPVQVVQVWPGNGVMAGAGACSTSPPAGEGPKPKLAGSLSRNQSTYSHALASLSHPQCTLPSSMPVPQQYTLYTGNAGCSTCKWSACRTSYTGRTIYKVKHWESASRGRGQLTTPKRAQISAVRQALTSDELRPPFSCMNQTLSGTKPP